VAFVEGSRNDVFMDGILPVVTVDPQIKLQKRVQISDSIPANRPKNTEISPDFDPMTIY